MGTCRSTVPPASVTHGLNSGTSGGDGPSQHLSTWPSRVIAPEANTALVQGSMCSIALSVALTGRDASFRHFALGTSSAHASQEPDECAGACLTRPSASQQLAAPSSVSLWRPEPTPLPHSHDTPSQGPHYLEVAKASPHQKRWGPCPRASDGKAGSNSLIKVLSALEREAA